MLREAIGYEVYADAGVAVPRTAYVRVAVNGEARGLYLLVETTDRRFLADRFGDDSGIVYEAAYGTDFRARDADAFELDEGEDPGRTELLRLIRAVEGPPDDVFYGATPLVDTTSFVSMMAVQVMIADWDNYYRSNNYRIYWHPSKRRWFFIPTGIDQTFSTRHRVTPFGGAGVLFRRCLMSERCTREYTAALGDAVERFERLDLTGKMDRLMSVIDEASRSDPKKPHSAAAMRAARRAMRQFIIERPGVVREDLKTRAQTRVGQAQ